MNKYLEDFLNSKKKNPIINKYINELNLNYLTSSTTIINELDSRFKFHELVTNLFQELDSKVNSHCGEELNVLLSVSKPIEKLSFYIKPEALQGSELKFEVANLKFKECQKPYHNIFAKFHDSNYVYRFAYTESLGYCIRDCELDINDSGNKVKDCLKNCNKNIKHNTLAYAEKLTKEIKNLRESLDKL